ncbi:MAG TPA: amylosucrase [Spirochaetaceae bacterium]|jgi:amylosucrase|nr:amylosucrase [Spirochaetaceae bacterium]
MDRLWASLKSYCDARLGELGLLSSPDWPEFGARFDAEFRRLAELLWELYKDRPDFALQFQSLITEIFDGYRQRPAYLKKRDRELPPESGWFRSSAQLGAVAYVDRYAGSFKGLEARIAGLKELGVSYLHLMPFFLSPEKESDGGYAVSSYRDTNPALGSMQDLEALASRLAKESIALVADFVFNHTSDEHEWAMKARAGHPEYQDYYWTFSERADTAAYQAHLRDIFPEHRQGSFSYSADMNKWVWTTFNSFQWDLNYRNPAVFRAMAGEMLSLANRGIALLRLDAVAFIWKELGTGCENLSQAHTLIRAFQSVARLACPSLLFKSEAIVHPDDIYKYIDLRECQLSYNPLLMAELWEASATKDASLLALSLRKRHSLPPGCAWVNYVRCHDDIGWTFADEDAAELGIKGGDHRSFLNEFFLGRFPGSFSRGVSFQYNPATGDRRICGTTASLAGVERALDEGLGADLDTALRRVLLLYGLSFCVGGIPLIYLGDELGALNRYEYEGDPAQAADSRWVHRPLWDDKLFAARNDSATVAGRIYAGLRAMARLRREHDIFGVHALTVLDSGHKSILAFHKQGSGQLLTVLANFSEGPLALDKERCSSLLAGRQGLELISGRLVLPDEALRLEACELLWVLTPAG